MVSIVRDYGIYLDSSLTMTAHISRTVSNCFAALRQVRSVRRSFPIIIIIRIIIRIITTTIFIVLSS